MVPKRLSSSAILLLVARFGVAWFNDASPPSPFPAWSPSMMTRYFSYLLLGLFVVGLVTQADAAEKRTGRMLMVTQSAGFKHSSVTRKDGALSVAERAMTDLGVSSGVFRVDCTLDCSTITKEQLDAYDIVAFYTTLDLPFKDEVRDYLFKEWVKKKGKGFIGTHSAADTFHDYEPYWEMLGGTFD